MFLMEIKPETSLTIVIKHVGSVLEFNTTSVRVEKNNLLVSPITKDGKMINFVESCGLLYQLILVNKADKRLYKWSRVTIKAVRDEKGNLYHMLLSEVEGQPYNRRQSYRVPIDIDGVARFGANERAIKVLIKDISSSGIGFMCNANVEFNDTMIIHLSFEDRPLKISFKIDCQPVRKSLNKEDNTYFYGCKFKNESTAVNNYVQRKQQRIRMVNSLFDKKTKPAKKY